MTYLKSKFPAKQDIWPVLSTILFLVFSRSIYYMFNTIPSWLYYMGIWDVLIAASYIMVYALIESLTVLLFTLFLAVLFPAKIYKDKFILQGSITIYLLTIWGILFRRMFPTIRSNWGIWELIGYPIGVGILTLSILIISSYVFDRFEMLQRPIKYIADKLIIFAYIYIPVSILGMTVVLIRNIF